MLCTLCGNLISLEHSDVDMPTLLALSVIDFANRSVLSVLPILAQVEEEEQRGYEGSVALVMLCLFLGVSIAIRPSKRTLEFKKPDLDD